MSAHAAPFNTINQPIWQVRELVLLGVFAAAAKVSTLLVALAGGGMNPVTLMAKNCLFTTLMLVLLFKLRKPGVLLLFIVVNMLVSLLLLGGTVSLLLPMFLSALLSEGLMAAGGGIRRFWGPFMGVAAYDILSKIMSLGVSWFMMRENPAMFYMALPLIAIGYVGALAGLFFGKRAVKELRHAGFITE